MTQAHKAIGFAFVFTLVAFVLPISASAATLSTVATQTTGIIPAGASTCTQLQVTSVVPYVYDEALHSFDITIADPSYVSVVGSVGNTGIPLNFMSRKMNPDGTLRIHVDIQPVPVSGTLPISLTLLSNKGGSVLCAAVVSFSLSGPVVQAPVKPQPPVATPIQSGTSSATGTVSAGPSTAATSSTPVVGGGLRSALSAACVAAGPYQLWFILLALFMVAVGLVAFAEPPLANKDSRIPLAAILIPLVLLLGFWYLATPCRVAGWIPVVLIVAAAIGLITAFRDKEMPLGTIIQLPAAKPSVKQTVTVTEKTTVLAKTVITPITPPTKNK